MQGHDVEWMRVPVSHWDVRGHMWVTVARKPHGRDVVRASGVESHRMDETCQESLLVSSYLQGYDRG